MIIEPRNGGLALRQMKEQELALLKRVVEDASPPSAVNELSRSVSDQMPEESEWSEWIVPELNNHFAQQLQRLRSDLDAVETVQEVEVTLFSLTIGSEHLMDWYGALNQARIMLEQQYRFSQYQDGEAAAEPQMPNEDFINGSIRYQIYSQLQQYLWQAVKMEGSE